MCGIFGIVVQDEKQLGPILIEAAQRLSYRGYDSVGCATFKTDGTTDLRKDIGKVNAVAERLNFAEMHGTRGITQLRWATFGAPSQVNAQPHYDSAGTLVGAHNGNVVNNIELRESFIAEGMTVRSTNDGESCVHAVERYVKRGESLLNAIRHAYDDLEGDYAFVIGQVNDDCLYAVKKGSGLVAGRGENFTCISSDLPSILPLTREIVRLNDGEIAILRVDSIKLYRVADGRCIEREIETITESMALVERGGYPHFMLKEIYEQGQVAGELLHLLNASPHVAPIVERMKNAHHLYLVACGTSYHACMLGAVYLAQLAGRAAIPVLAPQFIPQYASTLGPDDVGIFVSQSGETKDVLNALAVGRQSGMSILSLVNVIGSTLMRECEHYLPLACGYEISVPATKTFVNQVVAFLYLALRMGGHSLDELAALPALIEQTLVQTEAQVNEVEAHIREADDLYCLGYGTTYPIALEGALKLKEITYAHCEGMLSTEFKHGPLSAVQQGFPVIFVSGPGDVPLLISGINETSVRGAYTIVIAEENARLRATAHAMIVIPPSSPHIAPLLAVLPLQMLSYRISIARGYDPDFPRNLSKTLTVD